MSTQLPDMAYKTISRFIRDSTGRDNCDRCGMTHNTLQWSRINNPVKVYSKYIVGFAMCPTTAQPILLVWRQRKKEYNNEYQ